MTVDILFRDSILPLVPSIKSTDDCIQSLINTYELEVIFIIFVLKINIKLSILFKIESLPFLFFFFYCY